MPKFRIKADATFEAEDINDAFRELMFHFNSVYRGRGANPHVIRGGYIEFFEEDTDAPD